MDKKKQLIAQALDNFFAVLDILCPTDGKGDLDLPEDLRKALRDYEVTLED